MLILVLCFVMIVLFFISVSSQICLALGRYRRTGLDWCGTHRIGIGYWIDLDGGSVFILGSIPGFFLLKHDVFNELAFGVGGLALVHLNLSNLIFCCFALFFSLYLLGGWTWTHFSDTGEAKCNIQSTSYGLHGRSVLLFLLLGFNGGCSNLYKISRSLSTRLFIWGSHVFIFAE